MNTTQNTVAADAYEFAGYDEDGLAIYRTTPTAGGYDIPAPAPSAKTRTFRIIARIATAIRWGLTLGAAALVIFAAAGTSQGANHAHTTVQTVRD